MKYINWFYILDLNRLAIPCCALYIHKNDEPKRVSKRSHSSEETDTQTIVQYQFETLANLNINVFHLNGLNHKISAFTSKFVRFLTSF